MASRWLDFLRETLKTAVGSGPPPVGAGVRAFPRLGPGLFLDGYRILCFYDTDDLSEIRALVPVDCLRERVPSLPPHCSDTHTLLSHPLWPEVCQLPQDSTRLFVYHETPALRDLAQFKGWRLLTNPFSVRIRWQNKTWFRNKLRESGQQVPEWTLLKVQDLSSKNYQEWRRRWGPRMVFQIPDFPRGGGRATFFVQDGGDVEILKERWQEGRHRGHVFTGLMVSPWIEGPSVSMEGCVTPWGILHSPLQTQLLDFPEVLPPGRYGRFCGHQWGVQQYPSEIETTAKAVVKCVGESLRGEGYLGIFGIDFALDQRSGQLFALECNPRYTGAFPVLTLLQVAQDIPPLEGFHTMAWLGKDCPIPSEAVEQSATELAFASQILLFPRGNEPSTTSRTLAAGRYSWSDSENKAKRIGRALPFPVPPWNPMEFLIVDGPPAEGSVVLPGDDIELLLRLIFFKPVLSDKGLLEPATVRVINWIYERLGSGGQLREL